MSRFFSNGWVLISLWAILLISIIASRGRIVITLLPLLFCFSLFVLGYYTVKYLKGNSNGKKE